MKASKSISKIIKCRTQMVELGADKNEQIAELRSWVETLESDITKRSQEARKVDGIGRGLRTAHDRADIDALESAIRGLQ